MLSNYIIFPSMVWASTILQVVFPHVQVLVLFLQISRYPALPLGFLTFLCGTSLCRGLLDLFQCSMLTPPLHLALLVQDFTEFTYKYKNNANDKFKYEFKRIYLCETQAIQYNSFSLSSKYCCLICITNIISYNTIQ